MAASETVRTLFLTSKKHDFLLFCELLHTFFRFLAVPRYGRLSILPLSLFFAFISNASFVCRWLSALQIRSHDFLRYINLYVCMYTCMYRSYTMNSFHDTISLGYSVLVSIS